MIGSIAELAEDESTDARGFSSVHHGALLGDAGDAHGRYNGIVATQSVGERRDAIIGADDGYAILECGGRIRASDDGEVEVGTE